jgi:hypothetical protein
MKVTVLVGGVGGARFLQGVLAAAAPRSLWKRFAVGGLGRERLVVDPVSPSGARLRKL